MGTDAILLRDHQCRRPLRDAAASSASYCPHTPSAASSHPNDDVVVVVVHVDSNRSSLAAAVDSTLPTDNLSGLTTSLRCARLASLTCNPPGQTAQCAPRFVATRCVRSPPNSRHPTSTTSTSRRDLKRGGDGTQSQNRETTQRTLESPLCSYLLSFSHLSVVNGGRCLGDRRRGPRDCPLVTLPRRISRSYNNLFSRYFIVLQ